jgi:hypothetical protein
MPGEKNDGGFDLGDLGELADKAKDLVGDHADEVKDGIDAAAGFIGDKVGIDDTTVTSVTQTAKGFVDDIADDAKPAKKKSTSKKRSPSKKSSASKKPSSG